MDYEKFKDVFIERRGRIRQQINSTWMEFDGIYYDSSTDEYHASVLLKVSQRAGFAGRIHYIE